MRDPFAASPPILNDDLFNPLAKVDRIFKKLDEAVAPLRLVDQIEAKWLRLDSLLDPRAIEKMVEQGEAQMAAAMVVPPPTPIARARCTRPHVDEMQTWNPVYKPGDGPAN